MCHLLLLAPIIGLALFFFLPWRIALPPYGVIVAVSSLIYWKVMLSQRRRPLIGKRAMIGDYATVLKAGTRRAEALYRDEIWQVISEKPLVAGMKVVIEDVEGLRLKVSPLRSDNGNDAVV